MLPANEVGLAPESVPWRALVDQLQALIDNAFPSLGNGPDHGISSNGIDDRPNPADHGFRNE